MHDSLAYKQSALYTDEATHFQGNEYLLADAAYALTKTVMP